MPPLLDHNYFPHILDNILGFSPLATLTKFAGTSKEIREWVFKKFLSLERVIVDMGRGGIFGVNKDNTVTALEPWTVTAHRSRIKVIDIVGTLVDGNNGAGNVPKAIFKHQLVRFIRSDRLDSFIAASTLLAADGITGIRQEWSVALPVSFTNMTLGLKLAYQLASRYIAVFEILATAAPGARVAFLMFDYSGNTTDWDPPLSHLSMFVWDIRKWLLERALPVHLVFVNVEAWLVDMPPAEARDHFHTTLMAIVTGGTTGPDSAGVTGLKAATFMTLDEYKNDVGEEAFDLRTRFVEPDFRPVQPENK